MIQWNSNHQELRKLVANQKTEDVNDLQSEVDVPIEEKKRLLDGVELEILVEEP